MTRIAVWVISRLLAAAWQLWPRLAMACSLKVLEWTGATVRIEPRCAASQHGERITRSGLPLEPMNCSSRREEAHFKIRNRQSLLASAATTFMQGAGALRNPHNQDTSPHVRWLMHRLQDLPFRRKAQFSALAVAQFIRALARRAANWRVVHQGRPVSRLQWLVVATTDACNLRCDGCYAQPVWSNRDVPFDRLAYVTSEAERMGVESIILTGWGEPFFRPSDKANFFRLARMHPEMLFAVFTNGTLITAEDLDTLDRLGNVVLLLSLDGLAVINDARRGRGVFQRVAQTAKELKRRGLVFGVSVTVTSENYREVTSPEFVDTIRDWGALWALYLQFTMYPSHSTARLSLPAERMSEYFGLLAAATARQPLPLVDADQLEKQVGGCRARHGSLAFVDAVTGRVSACLKLPFASPSHNLFENASPGRLAELLNGEYFQRFWKEFPDSWRCAQGCKLNQLWHD